MVTDLTQQQQAPMIVLNLGGSARMSAMEINPALLQDGQQEAAGVGGAMVQVPGIAILLRHLAQRFAPLADESSTRAIVDLMGFQRQGGETIDTTLARHETIVERARSLGNFTMAPNGLAWMLLTSLRIPPGMWPTLLAPLQGNLPTTQVQYAELLAYIRRHCHLLEPGHMRLTAPPTAGPTYPVYPTWQDMIGAVPPWYQGVQAPDRQATWGAQAPGDAWAGPAAANPTTWPCPTCGGANHFHASAQDSDDGSTATEDDSSAFPLDEQISALPPDQQAEEAFFNQPGLY